MIREMVKIDEELCNGCGECIPNCHEGALQIIDGKARLISDLMCDGLGACVGHCPLGAMTIEKREAEPYDEIKVLSENIIPAGPNVVKAHLSHLKDHNETEYLNQAIEYLKSNNHPVPNLDEDNTPKSGGCPGSQSIAIERAPEKPKAGGCPGSQTISFDRDQSDSKQGSVESTLAQWPVQFHLVNPMAPYFKESDLLIAADCTAFAVGDFHSKWLKGRTVAIGCPKLDSDIERYTQKVVRLIDEAMINTITVMVMEVPCCGGMTKIVQDAVAQANRKVSVKKVMVSLKGEILSTEWI